MIRKRFFTRSLMALLILTTMLSGMAVAQESIRVRFIHAAADSPALDIYINGELAAADLGPADTTPHLRIPAGSVALSANLAGTGANLLNHEVNIEDDSALILPAGDSQQFVVVAEDLSPLEFGRSRLLIFNALENGSAIDVESTDASISAEGVMVGAAAGPFELSAGVLEFGLGSAVDDNNMAHHEFSAALSAGTSYILVIRGSQDNPQIQIAGAAIDGTSNTGVTRFVHAAQGTAAFDFKIAGNLVVPSIAFGGYSEHIALPSGIHEIAVSLGAIDFMTVPLDVAGGQMQTVVLMGSPSTLTMPAFSESANDVNEMTAVVRLINTIPNSVVSHLQLDSGAIVALNVAYGESGDAAQIVPGRHAMTLVLDIGDERGTMLLPANQFFAGSYYNLIAVAGSAFSAPRILVAETDLQRGARATMPTTEQAQEAEFPVEMEDSATDSNDKTMPENADSASEEEESLEDDTAQAAEMTAEDDSALEPSESAVSEMVAVSPYASVNVNPDSGLHLRQYPSSEAMSLAMLPADTNLMVLGRRGPSEYLPDEPADEPVDLSDFSADPAAGLYPVQDLNPADTWLFVTYQTADGGAVNGWVNAFYLHVSDEIGEPQRLASLPTIRQNQAGSAFNTSVRPPSLAEHIAVRVHNLDASAFLNIRMANDASSEVLGQLAPGAILDFIGLDADESWLFVGHEIESGKITRGWVSVEYVQLLLNGKPVGVATLRSLDSSAVRLLNDSVRGRVGIAEAGPAPDSGDDMEGIVGEVDLNADAALHLRRQPDAATESLALIPARSLLQLDGITASGDWFKVSYDGDEGWVAAMYLLLSMDGQFYYRDFLTNQLPVYDDFVYMQG